MREEMLLDAERRKAEELQKKQDRERQQKLTDEQNKARESMNQMNEMKKQQDRLKSLEQQIYQKKLADETQQMLEQQRMEHQSYLKNQHDYASVLERQAKERKDQEMIEKQRDRAFADSEKARLEKEAQDRQAFFNKLNNIQKANDQKHLAHMKFMQGDVNRAGMDEKAYLKSIEEQKVKDELLYKEREAKRMRDQNNTNYYLAQQIREKELRRENEKREEQKIAEYYKSEEVKAKMEEAKRREMQMQQKHDYLDSLNKQKVENRKKKQYGVLMTEHERLIHDGDIQAYQHVDFSKATIGQNQGDPVQQKYLDKALGVDKGGLSNSAYGSPHMAPGKAM